MVGGAVTYPAATTEPDNVKPGFFQQGHLDNVRGLLGK